MHQTGSAHSERIGARKSIALGRRGCQIGNAARMTAELRQQEVREIGHGFETTVELILCESWPRSGLAIQHHLPVDVGVDRGEDLRRRRAEPLHDRRVVPAARALAHHGHCRAVAGAAAPDLGVVR